MTTPQVSLRLLGLLSQPSRAVRILLSHGLSVGQVLCAINNGHEGPNGWAVHGHVGKDSRRMVDRGQSGRFGSHDELYVNPARAVTDELGYQHHTDPSHRKGDSFQIPVNIGIARNVVRNERMKLDIRNECAGVNPDSINER